MGKDDRSKLQDEKISLIGTMYADFDPKLKKQSIYKSIRLNRVLNGTAYYGTEPYDDAYRTDEAHFEKNCQNISRAFKKYHQRIFKKYSVDSISVVIFDETTCVAGISVFADGKIIKSKFLNIEESNHE